MEYGISKKIKHSTITFIARIVAMFLVVVMVMSNTGMVVLAQEIGAVIQATLPVVIKEGDYGESVHWEIDNDGCLRVLQKEGFEYEFFDENVKPWADYVNFVTSIYIDANCFIQQDDAVRLAYDFSDFSDTGLILSEITFGDHFDTNMVTDMSRMFVGTAVTNIDLSKFDTSNVTNMSQMFEVEYFTPSVLDFSSFDMAKVEKGFYISDYLDYVKAIYTPRNLNVNISLENGEIIWVKEGTDEVYTELPIGLSESIKLVPIIEEEEETESEMESSEELPQQDSGIYGSVLWDYENGSLTLSQDEMAETEVVDSEEYDINAPWYIYRNDIESIYINADILLQTMRYDWVNDIEYEVKMCPFRFNSYPNLKKIEFGERFNSADIESMLGLFYGCEKLQDIVFNSFDTSNVTDMQSMFEDCKSLEYVDLSGFVTPKNTSLINMFRGCSSLKTVDLSGLDTSNVASMMYLFDGCTELQSVNFGHISTDKVLTTIYMFKGCKSLKEIDLSNQKFTSVESASMMFADCTSLQKVDLGEFSSSALWQTQSMFARCTNLNEINFISFNLPNVQSIDATFLDCSSLQYIDLSDVNMQSATGAIRFFTNCDNLQRIEAPIGLQLDCIVLPITDYEQKWYRLDTGEEVKTLPVGLTKSVTLERVYGGATVTELSLDKNYVVLDVDATHQLKVSYKPEWVQEPVIEWGSSATDIVTVSENGLVTAHKAGTATITAEIIGDKEIKASCDITVSQLVAEGTWGDTVYWALDDEGLLSIWQDADVVYEEFEWGDSAPWKDYYEEVNSVYVNATCVELKQDGYENYIVFRDFPNLKEIRFGDAFHSEQLGSMASMFANCEKLEYVDLSKFNTSNVTTMSGMFADCKALTSLDVSSFDTSKVQSFSGMFARCENLNNLDVSGFDTSKGTDFSYIFSGCSSLTSIDVSGFDTSNAIDLSGFFDGCQGLTELDVTNFVTANAVVMNNMFFKCSGLREIDLSNFDTSNVATMAGMFAHCYELVKIDISNFNTEKVENMSHMFYSCMALETLDVSGFKTANVTTMSDMFENCKRITLLDVSKFDTGNVTDMSYMFNECYSLKTLDVSGFNTSNVKDMKVMFANCPELTFLDVSGFDTSNVISFSGMFDGCKKLENIDVSNFDTAKAVNMGRMFCGCESFDTIDISKFDTSNVQYFGEMFAECSGLTELDVSTFDTSSAIVMSGMFYGCTGLETLELGVFDTSKVKYMNAMFYECMNLKEVEVGNFKTGNVIDMNTMFFKCKKLTTLDVDSFDTSNVTNMAHMFYGCEKINDIDVSKWNTSNVEYMRSLFGACHDITKVDISAWDTSSVIDMHMMFDGCFDLIDLNISSIDTSNVSIMSYMFNVCTSLRTLDLSGFDMSKVDEAEGMLLINGYLTEIKAPLKIPSDLYVPLVGDWIRTDTNEKVSVLPQGLAESVTLKRTDFVEPTGIELDTYTLYLKEGESYNIGVTVTPIEATYSLWMSTSAEDIVEVETSGTFIARKKGEAIITVEVLGNKALSKTCKVVVSEKDADANEVTSISLDCSKMQLGVSESRRIRATIEPAYATNQKIQWSSSNEEIVTVDEEGLVTAYKAGVAVVTAKALGGQDIEASCEVVVTQYANSISIMLDAPLNRENEYVLGREDSVPLIVVWEYGDPWQEVIYDLSNDTAVVEDGKLIAKKSGAGILTVTAKNGDVTGPSASIYYRVYSEEVSGIKLNAEKIILDAHSRNTFLLEATIDNADVAYAKVEFTTDNPAMVQIEDHGNNTATLTLADITVGTATVTATATDGSGKSATCTIVSGTCVNSITVSAPLETGADGAYLLGEGKSAKLTAGILPANATVKTVTWTSSDETVVKVDAKGIITAVKPGLAFIYATATDGSEVNGTAVINVTRPASAVKLELVDNENGKVGLYYPEAGSEFEVKAVLTGTDGKADNVIQEVNYTVSGKGAKNVTYLGNGRFVATAPGVVTVTATAKDGSKVKASMKITIEQRVYAFDVQAPKKTESYVADGVEHWIAYTGAKDVTLTPVVTYNDGVKEYAPAKAYQNIEFDLSSNDKFSLDKKGTGIVVSKNTAPGMYPVIIKHKDLCEMKLFYIDVVKAEETYLKDAAIVLPKSMPALADDSVLLAEGSKVKLSASVNGVENLKGYTVTWSVAGNDGNTGTAAISAVGLLDLSKAKASEEYLVTLTVSKGETSVTKMLSVAVSKKPDVSAMKLVLAENQSEVLPASFNVQYVNNGKVFKVAEQIGAANLYSVTGGKKGVLTLEETENGYVVLAEGTGSAKITVTALDGSNVKKAITVKVVSAGNPVSKLATGSKKYSVEPNMPIAIPYSVVTKNGKAASDARVEWTSSNAGILQVSAGTVADAKGSCITTEEKGYLTLIAGTGMTGKVTLTGKALDGSKKTVKVTVNVVNSGKKEVTYKLSLQTPAKTPNGGVPGLALVTYGKSVKLTANVFPNKAKNKTISYTIVGLDANGQQTLSEAELKAKGVTVKKGVVAASKKSSYTGYVKVTATLDYMTYVMGEATPITAEKTLYVQSGVTKVEITGADGKVMKTATVEAGTNLVLNAKVTGAGTLTYANVSWSVNNAKLASVDANGRVTIKADAAKGKKVKVTATALDGSKKKAVVTITVK